MKNVKGKRYRRKTYKRRKTRRNRPSVAISRGSPIPDRFVTKMKYSGLYALTTAGVAVPAYHLFRLNSIFDPDYTGVGHQPLGHDELTPLYNKYVVSGVSWRVTYTNQSTSDYCDVCVIPRPNIATIPLMDTVFESPYVRRATIGPETGARNIVTMKGYVSMAKLRGVSKSKILNENDNSALIGANPVIVPTLQLYVENQNTLATITAVARVELIYYVTLYDRRVLSQS